MPTQIVKMKVTVINDTLTGVLAVVSSTAAANPAGEFMHAAAKDGQHHASGKHASKWSHHWGGRLMGRADCADDLAKREVDKASSILIRIT